MKHTVHPKALTIIGLLVSEHIIIEVNEQKTNLLFISLNKTNIHQNKHVFPWLTATLLTGLVYNADDWEEFKPNVHMQSSHMTFVWAKQLMTKSKQYMNRMMPHLICDLCTEEPTSSSGADGPCVHIFRVWPHQITKCSFVGDLLVPLNSSNLIQGFYVWWEASMNTQDLLIH